MTESFSDLVMPIFKDVIELRDSLSWPESADSRDVASLASVKKKTRDWIERAGRRAKEATDPTLEKEFGLAKYGLVAWIDEVLTNSAWGEKVGWGASNEERSGDQDPFGGQSPVGSDRLGPDLFLGDNNRASRFYDEAANLYTAIGQGFCSPDPLEAMLLCVALGFQGEKKWDQNDLQAWVVKTYALVSETNPLEARPFPEEPAEAPAGLAPRQGPALLVVVSVLSAITIVSTAIGVMLSIYARYEPIQ